MILASPLGLVIGTFRSRMILFPPALPISAEGFLSLFNTLSGKLIQVFTCICSMAWDGVIMEFVLKLCLTFCMDSYILDVVEPQTQPNELRELIEAHKRNCSIAYVCVSNRLEPWIWFLRWWCDRPTSDSLRNDSKRLWHDFINQSVLILRKTVRVSKLLF